VNFAIWQNGLENWAMWVLAFGKMDLTNWFSQIAK
jgi:hypothetical protein